MSQPPYQPGPYSGQQPGYGQQPGPGQVAGGYPGQAGTPGYPPSGGYPQQGGYQQFGSTGQYGQTPQYGYPGGYGPPPGAGRPRNAKPWLFAGGGVLVIGLAVVLILVLTSGSDTSSARGVAEAFVSAANSKDADKIVELSCKKYKDQAKTIKRAIDPPAGELSQATIKYSLIDVKENGDKATAEIGLKIDNVPDDVKRGLPSSAKISLLKEDGNWTFCGFGGEGASATTGGPGGS